MPLPPDLPIVDHHCHLSPSGEGIDAARRFRAAGGTHLFLATQNYGAEVPRTLGDYIEQFETTFRLAERIRADVGVIVYPVIAPYPIDLVTAAPTIGREAAIEVQLKAIDVAAKSIQDGDAVALGEVGRPHFATPPEITEAIEQVLHHAFDVAHDIGCPAVVHDRDLDAAGFAELAGIARSEDLDPARVVKHYARSHVVERSGIVPSYLARRELVKDVLADRAPWFLETDFLDDPRRPGAVLDLATVPRRALAIADEGPEGLERLQVPFVESPMRVYGIEPVWPDTRGR